MSLVKNINGSTNNNPPRGYSSWKEYWEEKKKRKFSYCACTSCAKIAVVGGHVKKVYGSNKWYIVPICSEHNNYTYTAPYEVADYDLLEVSSL